MFGLGLPELIIIFVIGLIIFGPKKLPELGKALGRGIAEFKRASQDIKDSIDIEAQKEELKKSLDLSPIVKTEINPEAPSETTEGDKKIEEEKREAHVG